jgi:hypothetical protein
MLLNNYTCTAKQNVTLINGRSFIPELPPFPLRPISKIFRSCQLWSPHVDDHADCCLLKYDSV